MVYSNRRHSTPVVGNGMVVPYTGTHCVLLTLLIFIFLTNLLVSEFEHKRTRAINEDDIPRK